MSTRIGATGEMVNRTSAMNATNRNAATLSDVALRAGVDKTTASKILNNTRSNTRVSQETRQRIMEAAAALRYRPNAVAQGLSSRRMRTIGAAFGRVEPSIVTNAYASAVLEGIFTACAEAGHDVHIFTEPWQGAELSAARFGDRRTDGVVVVSPFTDADMVPGLAALNIPLSVVCWQPDVYPVPCVDVDNEQATRLVVEHLLQLGHRRIAHLAGDHNYSSAVARRNEFMRVMQQAGVDVPPEYIIEGSYRAQTTGDDTRALLSLPIPPTAIFAANDALALGALQTATHLGVAVPEQLSIAGIGQSPSLALVHPQMTTIRDNLSQQGQIAAKMLLKQLEGHDVPRKLQQISAELCIGGTTAPAPAF